ncbi:MAG: hypothetical protein AB1426_11660 [Bacillota bacterium]
MKRFFLLAVISLVMLSSGCWQANDYRGAQHGGEKAPSFSALALGEGKTVRFPGDFKGQVVVLSFFSAG